MSSAIFTPSNQVRLTNVAVVRLKKSGNRFELACYKNKIIDFRNKATKDLDQVLQTWSIFSNVSKGQLAKKDDLVAAFRDMTNEQIIVEILEKGELQLGEKERDAQLDNLYKEVVNIVAGKCVNPNTRTPYPPALIEKALAGIRYAPNPKKSAKQQALECIRVLSQSREFPIARARMRLGVELERGTCEGLLKEMFAVVESEEGMDGNIYRLSGLIEPANYRKITDYVTKYRGKFRIESLREIDEHDSNYL